MRLNYSLSPELYLNFLRTNFCVMPCADAVPVSPPADALAAFSRDERMVRQAMGQLVNRKGVISSRS